MRHHFGPEGLSESNPGIDPSNTVQRPPWRLPASYFQHHWRSNVGQIHNVVIERFQELRPGELPGMPGDARAEQPSPLPSN